MKDKLKVAKSVVVDSSAAAASAPTSVGSGTGVGGDASSAERAKDVLRAAVRCFLALQAMNNIHTCTQFIEFFQRVLKTAMLAKMIEEIRQQS